MEFQWLPLTWDAVATLITGLAAVCGAAFVGWRQVGISQRQIEIQGAHSDHERKIRSNHLKLELLDRRMDCISQLRRVEHELLLSGDLKREDRRTLFLAVQQAELIFQSEHIDGVKEISFASHRAQFAREAQQRAYDKGDQEKALDWHEKATENENFVLEKLPNMIDSIIEHSRLHDV